MFGKPLRVQRLMEVPLHLPALLVITLLALSFFHGTRGLYETTEGRYAECAREMAQAGTWLEPMLNGQPHWTKPPLTYLAIRVPYAVLGPSTWAARFYLIPCFLVTVASVWWLAFRLWGDRPTARMSALVFATTLMPLMSSQSVSTDCLLTAALAVAQACFWDGVRKQSRLAIHLFWLLMGVAFLIKGPPSLLVIPALAIVWLRLPQLERRQVPLFAPTALALFLTVGLGWYAWEASQHPGLMKYWLKDEVVDRSFSDKFLRNPSFYCNFTIYLPVLLFGSLPWGGWLIFRWRRVWERVRVPGGVRNLWAGLPAETHWLVWTVAVPLCVFAASRSKLPLYILPLFVPMAVAMGRLVLSVYGREAWFGRWTLVTVGVTFAFFVAVKAIVGFLPQKKDMGQLYRTLTEQHGVRDPAWLAIAGDKALNGLSYYYDNDLKVIPLDQVLGWADAGGERYLLCSYRLVVDMRRLLGGRAIEEHELSPWFYMFQIRSPTAHSALKR